MAVVPDDDDHGQRISDEEEQQPPRSQTPPTPPGEPDAAHSPPPSHRPIRQRAMAQLRPVSIPNIVCDQCFSALVQAVSPDYTGKDCHRY